MLSSLGLAFLAGSASILSPCVIPLLPIVLGTAAAESKLGPLALCAGVVVSFVSVGLFVALIGFSIGLDAGFFRAVAALMLTVIGAVLLLPLLQDRLAVAVGPVSGWAQAQFSGLSQGSATSQFGVGILLGAVWAPCVGPTLGAASLLAAQGRDLPAGLDYHAGVRTWCSRAPCCYRIIVTPILAKDARSYNCRRQWL